MDKLKITEGRLLKDILYTAKWGTIEETGVCRLSLSDLDKKVRDWFIEQVKAIGCTVKVDEIGNIFATFPGKNEGLPTGIGSHLDTQPNGGRYDGILGVLSGLEVLRTMKDNNYVPNYPITLVDWTNEEGARFPRSLIASALWAKLVTQDEALNLESVDDVPVTVDHELHRIGYKGEHEASYITNPLYCHFELHIEQGPVLEDENKKIGIVTGVQAYSWNKITVHGSSSHAGTTPMSVRADAIEIAAKLILKSIEIAEKHGGLATIGTLSLQPSSINVIPDTVEFSYDARHVSDETLEVIVQETKEAFNKIVEVGKGTAKCFKVGLDWNHIYTSPSVSFNKTNISVVRESAVELFGEDQVREIVSGAGHDSCSTSTRVPTSMIFIPSKDGISHNPKEYSTPEEVNNGFKVLLNTILKYDNLRAEGKV